MEKVQALTVRHHIRTRLAKAPDVFTRYVAYLNKTKKPQTVFEYLKDVLLFWRFLSERAVELEESWTEASLKSITKKDVEDFLFDYLSEYERTYERLDGKLVTQEYKNQLSGQRRKLSSIRSFVRFLMTEEKWLTNDVTFSIELEEDLEKEVLTANRLELEAYFEAIDTFTEDEFQRIRNRLMSQFFLYMGLKTSEVLALDIPDIHVENKTMRIVRKDGVEEVLSLPERMHKGMEAYMLERETRPIPMGWHEQALFVSLQNKRLNPKTVLYSMERCRRLAGIQKPLSPQLLRNTYASRTIRYVGGLDEVAKRLGNRDKYATKRTYTRKIQE